MKNKFFNFQKPNPPFISFGALGFIALIFQIVFVKNLVLLFGLTAPAVATVLAVFFFGLALGSFIFGKLSDRFSDQKTARLYAWLFVFAGVYGFLFPLLFKLLDILIIFVDRIYVLDFSGFNFIAFIFTFAFLSPPAILFGAGFPVISKIFIREENLLGKKISLLYFVNTFGGVLGAGLAGFWLIPAIGNNATIFFAAAVSIITGGGLLYFFKVHAAPFDATGGSLPPAEEAAGADIQHPVFLYALFATGFLALALEVLYTKTLILFIGSSTYAFSVVLIVFLLGIAIGSLIASLFIDRITRGNAYFGIFLGLTGFWLFITTRIFDQLSFRYLDLLKLFDSPEFSAVLIAQFLLVFSVIFPVTLLMGMIFSLGVKLAGPVSGQFGAGFGRLYSANTFGGILGSLAAGFLFLPNLGYQRTMIFVLLAYFLGGTFFIVREKDLAPAVKGVFALFFILFVALSIFSIPWSKTALSFGAFPYASTYLSFDKTNLINAANKDEILFYKEGLSNVAVIKRGGEVLLRINGKTDASNTLGDTEAQILIGALPMLLHPEPREVLTIGLGSGITLGAITQFDEARNIDAVEIDPSVVEAAGYFKEYNHDALNDSRVKTILADGRNYLKLTGKKYDIISSEPSNLWVSGNVYLFTKEFYELAKTHLNKDGLMLQWLHVYSLDLDSVRSVLKTFSSVFPNVYLFETMDGGDLLIVGQTRSAPAFDFDLLKKKFGNEKIHQELGRIYIFDPYDLAPYLVADKDGIGEFAGDARINSDDQPFLEFSSPKEIYHDTSPRTIGVLADVYRENNPLARTIGGEEEKLKKYFNFSQKLFPFKIANANGDLFAAIDKYIEAKEGGILQHLAETFIVKRCNFTAQMAKYMQGDSAANQVWEKCSTVFNEVVIK